MRVLLFADFRSPHARGWREGLDASGIVVRAVSSESLGDGYDAVNPADAVSHRRQKLIDDARSQRPALPSRLLSRASSLQWTHTVMNLARLRSRRRLIREQIEDFSPDVVHGLRIPYEGLTVLGAQERVPVAVSTWGSDFVPQAQSDPFLASWMRSLMPRVRGFHTDSRADLARAKRFGLRDVPVLYAAGNFGVDQTLFYPEPARQPGLVVYPRKMQPNANWRGFVEAAIALADRPDLRFVGIGLAGARDELVRLYGAELVDRVELTGPLSREDMASLMRKADVVVSPTWWDGTPVTVLEAVACGARVVAGDTPQLRQLAEDGLPVDLIDAGDVQGMTGAILAAYRDRDAAGTAALFPEQFDRGANRARARRFYERIVG